MTKTGKIVGGVVGGILAVTTISLLLYYLLKESDSISPTVICPQNCSRTGTCGSDGTCKCNPGFVGDDCSKCKTTCFNNGVCDRQNGSCLCVAGFTGENCQTKIDVKFYVTSLDDEKVYEISADGKEKKVLFEQDFFGVAEDLSKKLVYFSKLGPDNEKRGIFDWDPSEPVTTQNPGRKNSSFGISNLTYVNGELVGSALGPNGLYQIQIVGGFLPQKLGILEDKSIVGLASDNFNTIFVHEFQGSIYSIDLTAIPLRLTKLTDNIDVGEVALSYNAGSLYFCFSDSVNQVTKLVQYDFTTKIEDTILDTSVNVTTPYFGKVIDMVVILGDAFILTEKSGIYQYNLLDPTLPAVLISSGNYSQLCTVDQL
eukprot:COSAG01_NODE_330_length_18723_cov_96.763155_15_plen_370_part_00